MKLKLIKSTVLSSVLALSFACIPVAVFAMESGPVGPVSSTPIKSSDGTVYCPQSGYRKVQTIEPNDQVKITCQPPSTTTPEPSGEDTGSGTNSGMIGKQHKLVAKMLAVCKIHSDNINMIMGRVVERGTKQTELFSTIATRVEKFYSDKGMTLNNYDQLVAAVNTAQTKAETDLATLKNMDSFKCDGSDPRGQITEFRTAVKTEIQDMKDLRTSVRNLIVGVKSVDVTTNSSTSNNGTQGGSNQ